MSNFQLSGLAPPSIDQLYALSDALLSSIKFHLRDPNGATMLPSYIHRLPSGQETGTALAVDLGGSTLRVAVIRLGGSGEVEVLVRKSHTVNDDVKQLDGASFFDWVAEKIGDVIAEAGLGEATLGVGLTWSFPIVYVSVDSLGQKSQQLMDAQANEP
jgi:hexokinase